MRAFGPGSRARRGLDRLADLVLGVAPANRKRAKRGLLSVCMYVAAICGASLAAFFGVIDPVAVGWMAAYIATGLTAFYVLIRSGWNESLADPSLSVAQVLFAVSALWAFYSVDGPVRGLNLLVLALPPLFGFVSISRRASAIIVALIPLPFGGLMLYLTLTDPQRFDPRVEATHFSILASCMAGLGVLLWQIGTKRERLRTQKIELSLALERIEAISTRDDLTGLYNRRYMTARLEAEVERRARGGAAFCACLIDIDFFKCINDTHGHARGDAVLRSFASVLQSGVRNTDVLGRWGGEEFLLLLPATSAEAALAQIEALRQHSAAGADGSDEAALRVRFSAGLTDDAGASVSEILDRADAALYRAKAEGRDRVVPFTRARSPAAAAS